MQTKNSKKQAPQKQAATESKAAILKTDLTKLTLAELHSLRLQIDMAILTAGQQLSEHDVVVTYQCALHTQAGCIKMNQGNLKLPDLLHPRQLTLAASRMEDTARAAIWAPLCNTLYDIVEKANPTMYALPQANDTIIPALSGEQPDPMEQSDYDRYLPDPGAVADPAGQ